MSMFDVRITDLLETDPKPMWELVASRGGHGNVQPSVYLRTRQAFRYDDKIYADESIIDALEKRNAETYLKLARPISRNHFTILPLFALDKDTQAWHRQGYQEVVKGPRQFEIAQYAEQVPLCLHYLTVWSYKKPM